MAVSRAKRNKNVKVEKNRYVGQGQDTFKVGDRVKVSGGKYVP